MARGANEKVERNKEMYRLRQQGWTFRRLAERFKVSLSRTADICLLMETRELDAARRKPDHR